MKEEEMVEGFYQACASLLGAVHDHKAFPYGKRTRWNNRTAGRGRFEGFGLIRFFGPNCIQVCLHNPPLRGSYTSQEAALAAIREAVG